MCIYIHTYMIQSVYISTYIYIYIERERDLYICNVYIYRCLDGGRVGELRCDRSSRLGTSAVVVVVVVVVVSLLVVVVAAAVVVVVVVVVVSRRGRISMIIISSSITMTMLLATSMLIVNVCSGYKLHYKCSSLCTSVRLPGSGSRPTPPQACDKIRI